VGITANNSEIVGLFVDSSGLEHGFTLVGTTYTQIDFPNSIVTVLDKISDKGLATGWFEDSSDVIHGYLLRAGNFQQIDYPDSTGTHTRGINRSGTQIVGQWNDSSGVGHGFYAIPQ
jgi:hypothetical protein